jgi:hypothetical protein
MDEKMLRGVRRVSSLTDSHLPILDAYSHSVSKSDIDRLFH